MGRWWNELPGRVLGPMFALDAARVGRRLSTFVARWAYLVVLAIILGIFFVNWLGRIGDRRGVASPAELSRFAESFFWLYAAVQFLFVAGVTPAFTAAAITDEKERKTLDFLLVTDLSGREIVFGKLAARVGMLVTFVLAGLPILSLIQFFGGIDPDMLLLAAGVTLATLLSLSGLSLTGSVALSRTREAVVFGYAIPAAYVVLSLWCTGNRWAGHRELGVANPFLLYDELMRGGRTGATGVSGANDAASWYIAVHLCVFVVCVAFAAARLRASARGTGRPRGKGGRLVGVLSGRRSEARPHRRMGRDPVLWREVYVDPGSGGGLLGRLMTVAVLIAVVVPFLTIFYEVFLAPLSSTRYRYRSPLEDFQVRTKIWVTAVTCGMGLIMMLRATVRGASAIVGEKDRDTWVSLLSTPLTCREILVGKWWGCIWGQRKSFALLGAVWAVGTLTVSVNPLFLALDAVVLAVYLAAFAGIGLRCSARARSGRVAIARAMPLAILALGGFWLPLFCCGAFLSLGGGGSSGDAIGYVAAFLAGCTPPFLFTGLAAVDFKVLHDMTRSDGSGAFAFASMTCGSILGTVGWGFAAAGLFQAALAAFVKEANRETARE